MQSARYVYRKWAFSSFPDSEKAQKAFGAFAAV
jgi:hypothetical protein